MSAVLAAIWHEAHAYRAAIHRSTCTARCDLRVDLTQFQLDGDCACRDFLIDMVVECHWYLAQRAGELDNPMGAARTHMRKRAPDWNRRRRSEMGAQCRTDRIRTSQRGGDLPDEFHRALLEYLVDEAGSMAPLNGPHELIWRLAVRCAGEFGGDPQDYLSRVVDGMAVVKRHCCAGPRVNAGTREHPEYVTWWEYYVNRPMGRRPIRNTREISPDLAPPDAESGEDDALIVAVLVRAKRRQPEAPEAALRAGIGELVVLGVLAEWMAAAVLADDARLTQAIEALSVLA